jgi:lipopolysaccharide/colanic/teichoic acid biosynthesis glycosyltransferase
MSLVGPRPPLVAEVSAYEAGDLRRMEVKPGMTGLWQMSGGGALTFREMIAMDLAYIDSWSFWKDVAILLKAPWALLSGRGK